MKTLRQQSQAQGPSKPEGAPSDPRLQKAQPAPAPSRPADPRLARDPRLSRNADSSQVSETNLSSPPSSSVPTDPRLARQAATSKPEPPLVYKPPPLAPAATEDEEGERMLRDKPVPIPLDPLMGMALRDPRSQLQQFSHIKKDLVLNKPSFAKVVLWSPEDLIPIPIPKQDFLPLPPGIPPVASIDPRLSRAQQQLHTAISVPLPASAPSAEPPSQSSSTLPDFELLSRILKTVNASSSSPSQTSSSGLPPAPVPAEKPMDPRMARKVTDPRLQPQKSALKQPAEPTAAQTSASSGPPAPGSPTHTIAPYDPRLFSVGGAGRGGTGGTAGSGSSVLSSISLYDPRTQSSDKSENSEVATVTTETKVSDSLASTAKPKSKEPLFVRKSALDQPEPEKNSSEQTTDRYNSYNRPRPKPSPSPNAGGVGGAPTTGGSSQNPQGTAGATEPPPAGVHNLPVSTLFSMVKQASKPSGTGSPFGGNSPAQPDTAEQDNASLKDVFKGFDPTASPFCQ